MTQYVYMITVTRELVWGITQDSIENEQYFYNIIAPLN